ncbi:MAG: HAD-IA family hydrolase [Actinomycetes bacterium]
MRPTALIADMAGTTIEDGGLVLAAFADALDALGIPEGHAERSAALAFVVETMGQSKIDVFTELFGANRADEANQAFEAAYSARLTMDGAQPIAGVPWLLEELPRRGVAVALTTGFSPSTREALLDALAWQDLIAVAISPADAGRGRPHPDMVLEAARRLGIDDLATVVVAGDTASDMEAGVAAGAGMVVGVLSGTDGAARLEAAGATHILDSLTALPGLLDL